LVVAGVATGVAAGLGGVVLTLFLHAVQHLAFGYTENTFLTGVERASSMRRVFAVGVGGVLAGLGWWLYRSRSRANVSVTHALTEPNPSLPMLATLSDALLQIVAVGAGGSLGREGAPRQVGAALGAILGERCGLSREERRIVLAAGAGAGLAAVYNVPLGGAVFALEILLASARPAAVVPALLASVIATVLAWPFLGSQPTYQIGTAHVSASVLVAAVLLGLVAGGVGVAFRNVMTRARTHAPHGWRAALTVPVLFTALGALAIPYPQLLGNGKNLAELAFTGSLPLGLAAALVVLKPAATAACLGSGAIGGLLTPSFSTGAALGLVTGDLWSRLWPGGDPTAFALVGAAALMAVTQRAPWTAIVLTSEFTHTGLVILGPIAVAVALARFGERTLRLRARWPNPRRRGSRPSRR
jgi:H+/Cl- antiporter ClcA